MGLGITQNTDGEEGCGAGDSQRHVSREEIQVSAYEDQRVQLLRPQRNACTELGECVLMKLGTLAGDRSSKARSSTKMESGTHQDIIFS